MIRTDNPSCTGGHDRVIRGYTKEALALDDEVDDRAAFTAAS